MVGTKNTQEVGKQKEKVFFKVKIGEKFTEYKAVYRELEVWGETVGGKDAIKDVVKRMIAARKGVTYGVDKAAIVLANYIAAMVSMNPGSRVIWGGTEVAVGSGDRLKLGVGIYYVTDYDSGYSGWRGDVESVFYGNDGLIGDAIHKVIKRLDFKEVVDVARLYRELLAVARHALNASAY